MVDADDNFEDNDENNERNSNLTKEKLSETIQKTRLLIQSVRRSQIITKFVNDHKTSLRITRQLVGDCITRWNSTFVSLKSFTEHKKILLNLFENKAKLSLTSEQQERLQSLELSSDEWTIIINLVLLLEPFYHAVEVLSGSKYPTIGLSLFVLRNIKDFLESDNEQHSNIFIIMKKLLLESINFYFNEDDDQHALLLVSNFLSKLRHFQYLSLSYLLV